MESGLQSLLLCSDDKVVRVLRRVLSEMEIAVDCCADAESAVQRLTRQRFEAVIVDCEKPEAASMVLRGIRSAPANKRAIIVAVLQAGSGAEGQSELKSAFAMGAHFVLFKPISLDRTRSSFRAVRALMKRERRRHARIPIEIPVEIRVEGSNAAWKSTTVDLAENGMAINFKGQKLPPSFQVRFSLPASTGSVGCKGEVAWEGNHVVGIRFSDMALEGADELREWIARQLAGHDAEDPTVGCKLTDLSLSACYLQTDAPFPVRTRLQLVMKVHDLALQIDGIVRVMHPGAGMGVEFTKHTSVQKTRVEEFIQALVKASGAIPELLVKPDSIDNSPEAYAFWQIPDARHDPLLTLFRSKVDLTADMFQMELRKQRGMPAQA